MSRRVPHAVPSHAGRAGDLTRLLARLLGPAWQAPDGSINAAQFSAEGDALDASLDELDDAASEGYPGEATATLEDWERVLYLPADPIATTATRRARSLAAMRGTLSGSPQDLETAAQTIVPGATLRERTVTEATAEGEPRLVFLLRFAIGASAGDTEIESRLRALLAPAIPAHCSLEFAATEYDVLITESGEELLTESGDEITTET